MTYEELVALLPTAAVEEKSDGELVIYTGLAINPADRDGPLIDFEEARLRYLEGGSEGET